VEHDAAKFDFFHNKAGPFENREYIWVSVDVHLGASHIRKFAPLLEGIWAISMLSVQQDPGYWIA
jgi:hypothetical protein